MTDNVVSRKEASKATGRQVSEEEKLMCFLKFDPRPENIVSFVDLKCELDLGDLDSDFSCFALYEPKFFDGVILRSVRERTTSLISASGKVVCTGAKTERDAITSINILAGNLMARGYPIKFPVDIQVEGVNPHAGMNALEKKLNYVPTKRQSCAKNLESLGSSTKIADVLSKEEKTCKKKGEKWSVSCSLDFGKGLMLLLLFFVFYFVR